MLIMVQAHKKRRKLIIHFCDDFNVCRNSICLFLYINCIHMTASTTYKEIATLVKDFGKKWLVVVIFLNQTHRGVCFI